MEIAPILRDLDFLRREAMKQVKYAKNKDDARVCAACVLTIVKCISVVLTHGQVEEEAQETPEAH